MGKTYKENRGKWKNNKDFQKREQKKHNHKPKKAYSPFEDSPDYHEKFSES